MKRCADCKVSKTLDCFARNKSKADGLQIVCKVCMAARDRKRRENPETVRRHAAKRKARMDSHLQFVRNYLESHPCVDCGTDELAVLEFDHVRGVKKAHVCLLVRSGTSLQAIKEEIAKCDVRCANCHRRRTSHQFGWWTSL